MSSVRDKPLNVGDKPQNVGHRARRYRIFVASHLVCDVTSDATKRYSKLQQED
jgi:hypothetical protein